MAEVTIGEYKGAKVLNIPLDKSGKFQFTFGITKARAIMEYIDDIQKFVEENEGKNEGKES